MNLLISVIVYGGIFLAFVAAISVMNPLRLWPFYTRRRSLLIIPLAFAGAMVALLLPPGDTTITTSNSLLDEFIPVYQGHEFHETEVRAPRDRIFAAIHAVTPREIALFQALTWIRRGGRETQPGVLNAPDTLPLLDTALRGGFVLLGEKPGEEIAFGVFLGPTGQKWDHTPGGFRTLRAAKAVMNFRLERIDDADFRLTTETRIHANSPTNRRRLAAYWRLIYPGSALIRIDWLRAIRRRAESSPALQPTSLSR